MPMNEASLRAWMSADDAAIEAEDLLKEMLDDHRRRGAALPSLAMQQAAARLRHRADFLLANLVEETLCGTRPHEAASGFAPLDA
jgi:hypothetical protein